MWDNGWDPGNCFSYGVNIQTDDGIGIWLIFFDILLYNLALQCSPAGSWPNFDGWGRRSPILPLC
jgi:hypothetical protein